jgi:hypothetical protein
MCVHCMCDQVRGTVHGLLSDGTDQVAIHVSGDRDARVTDHCPDRRRPDRRCPDRSDLRFTTNRALWRVFDHNKWMAEVMVKPGWGSPPMKPLTASMRAVALLRSLLVLLGF